MGAAPPPPGAPFSSDNIAGIAEPVLDALVAANEGPAAAYGDDHYSSRLQELVRDRFGPAAVALLAYGGTGANIVGLQTLLRPYQAVICPASSHINVDECGAPERFLGAKLIDVETPDGKLRPEDVAAQLGVLGTVHHAQPGAISVTQATEYGTLYSIDELRAVVDVAKAAGLRVHLDGARLANAVAALDASAAALTTDLGVDVVSFGGTKNGMAYGEAVVVLDPELVEPARFIQKQSAQLPSKTRFIAAQLVAMLDDDLWLDLAGHANAMAARLAARAGTVPNVDITQQPEANAVFARLPRSAIAPLRAWSPFYVWDDETDEVRWMTSFETTEDDVDRFVVGLDHFVGSLGVEASDDSD